VAQRSEGNGATIPRLSLTQRLAIQDYAARASWPAGFQIYERGASADGVFVVVRGRVVLRSRVRAGRGFVPWVATPGETFGAEGLSPSGCYATDARADEETETLFLSTSKLRAFIREQPAHALAVVGQVMAERTVLLDKLRELTTLSVEQRLVAALRRMAANDCFTASDGRIELCSSRYRLLCEFVGATRESVSLVLGPALRAPRRCRRSRRRVARRRARRRGRRAGAPVAADGAAHVVAPDTRSQASGAPCRLYCAARPREPHADPVLPTRFPRPELRRGTT
jgi:CRP-like cAMP-binding protein